MAIFPDVFNAASYFVDRHVEEGRGHLVAIECGERRLTYRDVFEQVNKVGNALRSVLGVRREERVVLLMHDGPETIAAFFGAVKIGAVPVPLNTRWTARDYAFVLRDSSARVLVVSHELVGMALEAARRCPSLEHVVVAGGSADQGDVRAFEPLVSSASA